MYRPMIHRLTLAALSLLLSSRLIAYDFANIATSHIVPAYQQLAASTQALNQAAQAYCAQPAESSLQTLQDAHVQAFLAWQGAQHLRFGPIQYLSREHRLQLWPDKRGTVSKHLRVLLEDAALTQPDFDISAKSVAVQGFSALEQLLFAEQAPDGKRCTLLQAITANLQQIGSNLLHDWQDGDQAFARYFSAPAVDNPLFTSQRELAGQLLNSLHTQLEFIQTQKLGRPLGSGPERARGRRAEAWRSGASLAAIERNLQACRALYQVGFAGELPAELDTRIAQAFDAAIAQLQRIAPPLAQSVERPAQWQEIQQLQQQLNGLRELLARDLAQALDLSLGFNSLDGD